MRGAIYLRESKYAHDSTSISRQEKACRGRAESLGVDDVDIYRDVDKSGFDPSVDRPGFNDLIANIDRYSHLFVYRVDRLTRQGARHLLTLVEDVFQPAGVALVSATEPVDTSGQFGEVFLVLLSTFGKMESERISERTTSAKTHLREAGYWYSGSPPFGYEAVEDAEGHKKLVQVEEEASLIRRSVQDVLQGILLTDVTDDFPMTYTGVQKLLTNPVIAGYQTKNGDIVFDEAAEPVMVTDTPIISPATFSQLQATFSGSGHSRARKHLLTGILVCDECGAGLTGNARSYQCQGCDSNTVSRKRVEKIVTDWVKSLLPTIIAKGAEEDAQHEDDGNDDRHGHLNHLLSQLNNQIDTLTIHEGLDYTSPQVARLEERARKVQEELLSLKKESTAPQPPIPTGLSASNFDEYETSAKRLIISHITDHILIRKASSRGGRFDSSRVVLPEIELSGR